jgi:hypothetical protein
MAWATTSAAPAADGAQGSRTGAKRRHAAPRSMLPPLLRRRQQRPLPLLVEAASCLHYEYGIYPVISALCFIVAGLQVLVWWPARGDSRSHPWGGGESCGDSSAAHGQMYHINYAAPFRMRTSKVSALLRPHGHRL